MNEGKDISKKRARSVSVGGGYFWARSSGSGRPGRLARKKAEGGEGKVLTLESKGRGSKVEGRVEKVRLWDPTGPAFGGEVGGGGLTNEWKQSGKM